MDWGPGGLANRCPPKSEADNVGTYVSRFAIQAVRRRTCLETCLSCAKINLPSAKCTENKLILKVYK